MRLWKKFDGEPFLINPRLGILAALNPRHKKARHHKKGASMARAHKGWGRGHMAWVRSFRKNKSRGRKARRNYPMAGVVANPHKKRRRHYAMNPRKKHYRRNPKMFSLGGFSLPPLKPVLYGFGGFVGTPFLEGTLSGFLPSMLTANIGGRYLVKIGSVAALTVAAKAIFGRDAARYVAIGGGVYVAVSAARDFLPAGTIPGLNAYVPIGAYTRANRQLGAAPWGAVNSAQTAGGAGMHIVGSRFRRFQ